MQTRDNVQATQRTVENGVGPAPLVSVVIPTYNAARYIDRALSSVAGQVYLPMEIIVSDDASTDATVEIVRACSRLNVQLLNSPEPDPTGPGAARNRGLNVARGKYVAFLDSDDEWLEEKVVRQVQFMESHPECSMVVCDGVFLDEQGNTVDSVYRDSPPISGPDAWRTLLLYSFVATPCVMARQEAVMALGGFDESLRIAQDQDMWIRLALVGQVGVLDEQLVVIHTYRSGHMNSNAHLQSQILLGMVERHVLSQKERLEPREVRKILGLRYATVGQQRYISGESILGLKLICKAILWRYRPLQNFFFLIHASALGRWLKSLLRQKQA